MSSSEVWYPRAVPGLEWRQAEGAFVASRPGDARVHALNSTGVMLLELANGRHSVDEMTTILQQAFGLDHPPANEVTQFLEHARRNGLVQ